MKKNLIVPLMAVAALFAACNDDDETSTGTAPASAAIAGNTANTCPDETVALTATSESAVTFQWKKDNILLPDQTSATLTVTQSGAYTVAGVNGNGTSPFSAPHAVTIAACPPVISGATANECPVKGVTLTAAVAHADSYVWKNGDEVLAETSATLTVTKSGTYTVAGVNTSVTGPFSAQHVVTITYCYDPADFVGSWSAHGDTRTSNDGGNPPFTAAEPDWSCIIEQGTGAGEFIIKQFGRGTNADWVCEHDIKLVRVDDTFTLPKFSLGTFTSPYLAMPDALGYNKEPYEAFFGAFYMDPAVAYNEIHYVFIEDYPVAYDPDKGEFDFSDEYTYTVLPGVQDEGQQKTEPVFIGGIGVHNAGGYLPMNMLYAKIPCYANLKLTKGSTPTESAARPSLMPSRLLSPDTEGRIIKISFEKYDPSKFTRKKR